MKTSLSFVLLFAAALFFSSCKEDPVSDSGINSPMKPPPPTPAKPAITYTNNGYVLCVMDTDGTHQATIYTPASGNIVNARPSWSPTGSSIAFIEHPGATYHIKLIDVSVNSKGVAAAAICELSTHFLLRRLVRCRWFPGRRFPQQVKLRL